jgi:S-adenosylmethionine hydrolase
VNPDLILPQVSATFHGRDVFAPASAYLIKGISPSEFGPELQDIVTPQFATVIKEQNQLFGEILYIDSFGNIVTNLQAKDLESIGVSLGCVFEMTLHAKIPLKLHSTYMDVEVLQPLALIGSHRFLEISIHRGNAAKAFKAKIGDEIILRPS